MTLIFTGAVIFIIAVIVFLFGPMTARCETEETEEEHISFCVVISGIWALFGFALIVLGLIRILLGY